MSTQLDLKSTEKASYKLAAFGDGLNDLTLGLILIALGLFPITRAAFGPTLNALVFFLVLLLAISGTTMGIRKRLTPSRLGLVSFGPSSRKRLKTGLLVTTLLLALTADPVGPGRTGLVPTLPFLAVPATALISSSPWSSWASSAPWPTAWA